MYTKYMGVDSTNHSTQVHFNTLFSLNILGDASERDLNYLLLLLVFGLVLEIWLLDLKND